MTAIASKPIKATPEATDTSLGTDSANGATANFTHAAMLRSVRGEVNVMAFGAVGDNVTNDTAAIQAAIDTGLPVYFPPGDYRCVGLTQATDLQSFRGAGAQKSRLVKNGNGVIFASTGNGVHLEGLSFRGESATPVFTGDNVTFSGASCTMLACGSRWAKGRAVKATGGHFCIFGSGDIYQTADVTGTGYDIEVGVSGTATLYHELHGVYSSQPTGGILLTDTGSATIVGGQFGKLNIKKGTGPGGTNGGKTIGARILGDVTVEASSAMFAACQFGVITMTFASGVSGGHVDTSNIFEAGSVVVNNGSTNLIVRSVAAHEMQFGPDSSNVAFSADPGNGQFVFPKIRLTNPGGLHYRNAANSGEAGFAAFDASDNFTLSNGGTNKVNTYGTAGTSSRHQFTISGVVKLVIDNVLTRIGGTASPGLASGSGSPEGVVTAPIGSMYMRTDGGANTSIYVKESGTGNTGWVAK